MAVSEGANYAPDSMPKPVVEPGEFVFAAMHLDHGHIGGMTQGLLDAGGTLKWVFDTQPERAAAFKEQFPQVEIASSEEQVLADPEVHLVAAAAVPVDRAPLECARSRRQRTADGWATVVDRPVVTVG